MKNSNRIKAIKAVGLFTLAFLAALVITHTDARTHRSGNEIKIFKFLHPCPATGAQSGACPGFVIDHVLPLCAGGPDKHTNMQWQTTADARKKDVLERRQCAAIAKAREPGK